MNGLDVTLLLLGALLVIVGLIQGLLRALIGVAAAVLAFALAARFHEGLAARLPRLEIDLATLRVLAYGMIFLGVLLLGGLAARLAARLARAAMLGWADRLGGAALGLAAALLLGGLLVMPIVAYAPAGARFLAGSRLAPYVTVVSDLTLRLVPAPLSARYEERIGELRRLWRGALAPGERASWRGAR